MQPTRQLKEEHNGIKMMLQILEVISQKLESGQKVKAEHLDMIMDFIEIYTDKCHHGKEEGILFPAMEQAGITRESGPIEVMLAEHAVGRNYVKQISQGISEYQKDGLKAAPKIVKNARGYIELLTQHIYKEDTILYPMADQYLPAVAQGELMWRFEQLEEEFIGAGEHERLDKALNTLIDIYLQ
jgi:hemerythrin-like domain-containing protein